MTIKQIGRFQVGRMLGSGSQGKVYLCHDTQLERRVAIKLLNQSLSGCAFRDEARTMSRLQHPNIVSIYEMGQHKDTPYLVFEYVEGELLSNLIRAQRMELSRVLQIFQGLLEGMAEAHSAGVVHRDLKPANIIINRSQVPKIMDFGIARLLAEQNGPDEQLIGTPRYLAPEYIQYAEAGPQADVFALGLILDEMLTGMPVFSGSQHEVINAILKLDPVVPSQFNRDVDEKLDRFVLKALAKDPTLRHGNASEMRQAFSALRNPGARVPKLQDDASGTLEFLLRRMRRKSDFPALSNSVRSINMMSDSGNQDVNQMAGVIVKDFALTNKILKVVNSAYYGRFSGHIGTVSRAVVVLGIQAIRSLAASLIFFDHIEDKQQAEQLRVMISSAIFRATLAHHLAEVIEREEVEAYYLTALLRDLGKLLVTFYLPEEAKDVDCLVKLEGREPMPAQQSVLGVSFEKIGIEIARQWNFPDSLIDSLRDWQVGRKPTNQVERRRLVSSFSDEVLVFLVSTDATKGPELKSLVRKYAMALNMNWGVVSRMIRSSVEEFGEMAEVLTSDISQLFVDQLTMACERLLSVAISSDEKPGNQTGLGEKQLIDDNESLSETYSTRSGVMAKTDTSQESTETLLMDGLNEVTCMLVGEYSMTEIFNVVLETMYRSVSFHRVVLALLDRKQGCICGRLGFGEADERFIKGFRLPVAYHVDMFHGALKNSVDVYIADTTSEKIQAELPEWYRRISDAGSFLLLPLVINQRPVGLIYADHIKPHGLKIDIRRLNLLKSLRNQIVLAVR
ncbi:MAG: HDOD domain-containing protein [Candidatus Thiodiazotropha sp.]